MQRIFNVENWVVIEPGQTLEYPSERPRLVRLEVNAAGESSLYMLNAANEAFFLALVKGRDTIEFVSSGKFSLSVDGNACSVYTVDGSNIAHTVEAPVSFTRIVERRRRNPELELIAAQMAANMNRILEQQSAEREAEYRRRERLRDEASKAREAASAAKSVSSDDGKEPAPAGTEPPIGGPETSKKGGKPGA